MLNFKNKIVAITGAGLGIGRATAKAFADAKAQVIVIDINSKEAENTTNGILNSGGKAFTITADIADEKKVKSIFEIIDSEFKRLDVLVNNAGIYKQGNVIDTTLEEWNKLMAVNLTSAFLCSREAIHLMLMHKAGVIVNVASEAGLVGIKEQTAYNVSKAGMIALTKSMAVDYAPLIRVNCVCPGTTLTPLVENALNASSEPLALLGKLESIRPMLRLGKAEEIASAILMMACDTIAYSTGAVLSIDGGYTSQ